MLLSRGITQSVITAQLSITEGDVRDVETVRKTLSPAGKTADVIVSGIGEPYPVHQNYIYHLSPAPLIFRLQKALN